MNLPHLGIKDIGIQALEKGGVYWLIHLQCPKQFESERHPLISFSCYIAAEIAICDTCDRQFGKKACEKIKDLTKFTVEFSSFEEVQKLAAEVEGATAFRAYAGLQPEQPSQD